MNFLSDWWQKWIGSSADDKRNFGWRITEALAFKPEKAFYLIDLRLGFKRDGKWRSSLSFWKPVTQNFWNGILCLNIYVTKKKDSRLWFPRFAISSRHSYNRWSMFAIGWLFDRGEFGLKLNLFVDWWNDRLSNPGPWAIPGDPNSVQPLAAKGWEEGSI